MVCEGRGMAWRVNWPWCACSVSGASADSVLSKAAQTPRERTAATPLTVAGFTQSNVVLPSRSTRAWRVFSRGVSAPLPSISHSAWRACSFVVATSERSAAFRGTNAGRVETEGLSPNYVFKRTPGRRYVHVSCHPSAPRRRLTRRWAAL
jgi:hypothetical protein